MKIHSRLCIVLLCLFGLLACAESDYGESLAPDRTDRNNLVNFGVPDGWNNKDSSSGRHFSRDNPAEDQAIIYLDALDRPPSLEIEFLWEQTKEKHEIQDQVLQRETASKLNGFELREAVYEADRRGQRVVYHDIFLFRDNLQVQMSLNASSEAYPGYIDDFRAMVGSVRMNGATEQPSQ